MNSKPLISIITVVYNAEKTLEQTILSVINQSYSNIEFIIIDGGSKDGTTNIINKYSSKIAYWVSEPDNGIYDAWNKGIKNATGDWICFLGADDVFVDGGVKKYVEFIQKDDNNKLDYISSRVEMIDENGESIWINGWKWEWPQFLRKMTVAHPGSFHSKQFFDKYGLFDTSYRVTGDYELLLRPKENLKTGFFNEITVKMAEGGTSDSIRAIKEHCQAARITGGGSFMYVYSSGAYVLVKSKLNKLFRKLGMNINIKRPVTQDAN